MADEFDRSYQRYYRYPPILWLSVGDWDGEMIGGPARAAGFYIMPFCTPMCCRPAGPFITAAVALAWARQEVARYNPNAGRWQREMNPWRTVTAWTRQRVFERCRWAKRVRDLPDGEHKKRGVQPKRRWWPRMPQPTFIPRARKTRSEKKAEPLLWTRR
jgi:hypothetical protein